MPALRVVVGATIAWSAAGLARPWAVDDLKEPCRINIKEPTDRMMLAGRDVEVRAEVYTSEPIDIYVSIDSGNKWHLWRTDIQKTLSKPYGLEMELENLKMGEQTFMLSGHQIKRRGTVGAQENTFLCKASRTVYMVPVPSPPYAWWQGFSSKAPKYQAAVSPILSLAEPINLSFEPKKNFIGASVTREPLATPKKKTLVAMFGDRSSQTRIDRNVQLFPEEHFSIMMFIYDDSEWTHFSWFERVVAIRVKKQMKWWYIKRFMVPDIVLGGDYDYVMIIDADVSFPSESIDPKVYMDTLREYDVWIGQPSHRGDSQTTHKLLFQNDNENVGVWTNFVESGPALNFATKIWRCVWEIIQTDLVTGFGYDLLWSPVCAPNNTAVIHSHAIRHDNEKIASMRPNWMSTSVAEGLVSFERMRKKGNFPEDYAQKKSITPNEGATRLKEEL